MATRKGNAKKAVGKQPVEEPVVKPEPVMKPEEDHEESDTEKSDTEDSDTDEEKPQKKAPAKKGKGGGDEKQKMRTPTVTGTQFAKAYEKMLKERLNISVKGADVLEVMFDTIKELAKQTMEEQEADNMQVVAKKGITINLPAFGGQKNTAKFSVGLSKNKKKVILPRTTMTLHKMYKEVWVKDMAAIFKPAIDVAQALEDAKA